MNYVCSPLSHLMGKAGFQAGVNGELARRRGNGERGKVFYNWPRNDCQHPPFNQGKTEWVHRCPHTGGNVAFCTCTGLIPCWCSGYSPLHLVGRVIYLAPFMDPYSGTSWEHLKCNYYSPTKKWKSLGLLCFLSPGREWIIMNSLEYKQLFENFPRRLFTIK